jgi:hypothetical protein
MYMSVLHIPYPPVITEVDRWDLDGMEWIPLDPALHLFQ